MGGEARDPKKGISRAIISSMFIGAAIYIALEVASIAAFPRRTSLTTGTIR